MTCAEFRDLWTENREARAGQTALRAHTASCAACASWTARSDALDAIFQDALLVAPPPAVAARIREIAWASPVVAPARWWSYLPELLVVAFLALGLLGLSGETSASLGSLVVERVGDLLLAVSILWDPPLVSYLARLWGTVLEASAALVLLALLIARALPFRSGNSME
ncbi:MAG TPA: hypothetical protein VFZ25_10595 [Chloroflexota bacterium]|nr:hypothetical protein [Chloroflexota bacterium]